MFSDRTPFARPVVWALLLVLGQCATLALVDAGTRVHFEHLRPAMVLRGDTPLSFLELAFLTALFAHVAVVLWGLSGERRELSALLGRLGFAKGAAVVAVWLGASAFPSPEPAAFGLEVTLYAVIRASQLGCVFLLVVAWSRSGSGTERIRRVIEGPAASETAGVGIDRLAQGCAVFTVVVAAVLSFASYERHPHVPDEVGYVFQARTFAAGYLEAPAPRVPDAFEPYLIDCDAERCRSPFPPAWPALLAVGTWAGVPWLVNPVLGGLNVLLTFLLVSGLMGRPTARLSVLLLAASPMHLFMSMSLMSHVFSLCCALVAAMCVLRMVRDGATVWGIPGGAAIGVVSLTRPLEAVVVAGVLGLAALFARGRRMRFAPVVTLGLACGAVASLNIPYNLALTGDPTSFPVMEYMERHWGEGRNSLGFGPEKEITWDGLDPFPGHGLADVVVNAQLNVTSLQIELFGWAVGSLVPVLLLLVGGGLRAADVWMFVWIAFVVASQSLYWFSGGPDFGARYWFTVIVPLVALSARSLLRLESETLPRAGVVAAAALCGAALLTFVPWRALDKYPDYRNMQPGIREILAEQDFGRDILLVRGDRNPDLASAVVYAPIDPESDETLILWERDAAMREQIRTAYPDRRVWIVDGPTRTGAGYRLLGGPFAEGEPVVLPGG